MITTVLLILAIVFLALDAFSKVPSWTWGACLLVLLYLGK